MRSPLNYLGGKSKLAKIIVPMIPTDHVCYCEPFSGAAWVMYAKPPSKVEVINDLDGELITFWRIIQNHLQPFLEYFKYAVVSRKLFEIEKAKSPGTLTDIQRAVRFYYLQRLCFGGKVRGKTFGTSAMSPLRLNLSTIEESLLEAHWRLKDCTIENLDAIACIQRYDRPTTFFYLDPPYWFNGKDYNVPFEKPDFDRLLATLKALQGRFILSLNDSPEVRSFFAGFTMKRVELTYSCGNARQPGHSRAASKGELLIHNLNARAGNRR